MTMSRGVPSVFSSASSTIVFEAAALRESPSLDEFGGRGYVPFETTDLDSGTWTMVPSYNLPSRPRHGTVLPVTAAEYNRLRSANSAPFKLR